MNVPFSVGVPLMVMVLEAQVAVTPTGSPVAVPIPVAPLVVWVIAGKTVFIQTDGDVEAALTVLAGEILSVPVASTFPQPPVKGMV